MDLYEEFICYNDDVVSKATIKEAMNQKLSKNELPKRTPYILVYHHMN